MCPRKRVGANQHYCPNSHKIQASAYFISSKSNLNVHEDKNKFKPPREIEMKEFQAPSSILLGKQKPNPHTTPPPPSQNQIIGFELFTTLEFIKKLRVARCYRNSKRKNEEETLGCLRNMQSSQIFKHLQLCTLLHIKFFIKSAPSKLQHITQHMHCIHQHIPPFINQMEDS